MTEVSRARMIEPYAHCTNCGSKGLREIVERDVQTGRVVRVIYECEPCKTRLVRGRPEE